MMSARLALNSLPGQVWPLPSRMRNSTTASGGQSQVRSMTVSLRSSSTGSPVQPLPVAHAWADAG